MHPRTIATIDELGKAEWFSRVGVHDSGFVAHVSSWQEAVVSCATDEWKDLCLEAANQYRERLLERNRERFNQWNSIVRAIRPAVNSLVKLKTSPVMAAHDLPRSFTDSVRWDILHLCMEAEYADIYPPGYYASQGYWYLHGHFPCGWRGEFPDGMLVVF